MKHDLKVSSIEQILDDYKAGKMVILVDDEERENEGDLVIAASCVTPEAINFMASKGRGLICLTLTEERCLQLQLPLMVSHNNAKYSTNFTVSIDAAEDISTGISAQDRAITIERAIAADSTHNEIVTPGHVFPVMAQPGGVLTRAGHTEAGVDLATISGLEPASVICEILNDDGSMARLPDLIRFGKIHDIRIGTIADLIKYRLSVQPTVVRVDDSIINTRQGEFRGFIYEDKELKKIHMALVYGNIKSTKSTLVRVHSHRGVYDALSVARGTESWSVDSALARIVKEGAGVVVLLQYSDDVNTLKRRLHDEITNDDHNGELRMIGAGSQILSDLKIQKVRVLGTPKKTHALSGFGIKVLQYIDYPEEQ
ncbi:MAG: 3,4-dihydroxy-2-butanone-4-phosphate synthase [Acidiferrobacteraceae bacterium]|nr:3,4-dihydroxy-2-butanone-4-phosphate synthase [Acidiferrobacteraceae bacterium]